jgi:uncharacterized protein
MKKRKGGFASMDPAKVREIASMGGRAAHAKGTAHKYNSDTARTAGRKGGLAPHRSRGRSLPAEPPPAAAATDASAAAE